MPKLSSDQAEQYAGPLLSSVRSILSDVESGHLTASAAEAHLIRGAAQTIDLLIPTGSWDAVDDVIIDMMVREVVSLVKDLVTRDAGEMRKAAGRKFARVDRAREKGRNMIGLRSVEHVEERAIELLLQADLIDSLRLTEG